MQRNVFQKLKRSSIKCLKCQLVLLQLQFFCTDSHGGAGQKMQCWEAGGILKIFL